MPRARFLSHQRRKFNPRVRPAHGRPAQSLERAPGHALWRPPDLGAPAKGRALGCAPHAADVESCQCSGSNRGHSCRRPRPRSRPSRRGGKQGPHLRALSGARPRGGLAQAPGPRQRWGRQLRGPRRQPLPSDSLSSPCLMSRVTFANSNLCLHTEVKDLSLSGPQGKRAER